LRKNEEGKLKKEVEKGEPFGGDFSCAFYGERRTSWKVEERSWQVKVPWGVEKRGRNFFFSYIRPHFLPRSIGTEPGFQRRKTKVGV